MAALPRCAHVALPGRLLVEIVCSPSPFPCEGTNLIMRIPASGPSLNLISPQGPNSNYHYFGVRVSTWILKGPSHSDRNTQPDVLVPPEFPVQVLDALEVPEILAWSVYLSNYLLSSCALAIDQRETKYNSEQLQNTHDKGNGSTCNCLTKLLIVGCRTFPGKTEFRGPSIFSDDHMDGCSRDYSCWQLPNRSCKRSWGRCAGVKLNSACLAGWPDGIYPTLTVLLLKSTRQQAPWRQQHVLFYFIIPIAYHFVWSRHWGNKYWINAWKLVSICGMLENV